MLCCAFDTCEIVSNVVSPVPFFKNLRMVSFFPFFLEQSLCFWYEQKYISDHYL